MIDQDNYVTAESIIETKKRKIIFKNIRKNNFDVIERINQSVASMNAWSDSKYQISLMPEGGNIFFEFLLMSLMEDLKEFKLLVQENEFIENEVNEEYKTKH
jgi:hypothetical protein